MNTLIVVSGGDAPGINTALQNFTKLAAVQGDTVLGALGGFPGVLNDRLTPLTPELLSPLAGLGGTFLPSSRTPVLASEEGRAQLAERLKAHQVDNVLLFGGDGTLRHIPPVLHQLGIACIGIPTTIDNDIAGTEMTLGFDSACNAAYQIIDGIKATAYALRGRVFTVETLGGSTGFIAQAVALGSGAHAVLVPEYDFDLDWLGQRTLDAIRRDEYALIVLSEGTASSRTIAEDLTRVTEIRVRDTRLGHGQRGAAPSHQDRVLARQMTHTAYHGLRSGFPLGIVAVRQGQIMLHEGTLEGFAPRIPDRAVYNLINGLED